MGWSDFIDTSEEPLITVLMHEKGGFLSSLLGGEPKKITTIGMSDKRSFLCEEEKNCLRFISSKLPITTIEYIKKKLSIWVWIALALIAIISWSMAYIIWSYLKMIMILLPIVLFVIAYILRQRWQITTVIGNSLVILKSRKDIANANTFIRIIHQKTEMAERGFSQSPSELKTKRVIKYTVIAGVLMIALFIFPIFF